GRLARLPPLEQELGMEQALPLLQEARVRVVEDRAEEALRVEHRLVLGQLRDVQIEGAVELREIAQEDPFAPLEPVALHVVAEAHVPLDHLAADRLRTDVFSTDPRVMPAELVERP